MPSQYPTSSSSRGRRPKDKEARVNTSSTSRHRSSRKDHDSYDRSEPRSPPLPSSGIYSQLNLTLDQLPALPDSIANTPSASSLNLDGTGEDTPKAEPRKDPLQYRTTAEDDRNRKDPLQYQTTVEDDKSDVSVGHVSSSPTSPRRSTVSVTQRDHKDSKASKLSKGKETEVKRQRGSSTPAAPQTQSTSSSASAPHSPSTTPTTSHSAVSHLPPLTTHASAPLPSEPPPQIPQEFSQPSATPPPTSPLFQQYPPQPYYYQGSPPLSYMPMMIPPNGMQGGPPDTQSMPPMSPPYSNHRSPTMDQMSGMHMHHYQAMTTRSPPYSYGEPMYGMAYHQPMMDHPGMPGQGTPGAGGDSSSTRSAEDPDHLLRRVQEVLPDLSILVNKYRETHGQLSTREIETRQSEEAHSTLLAQKEFYLQALKDQIKEITLGHEKEKAALNLEKDNQKRDISERLLEVGDLQERVKGLEESHAKLEQDKLDLIGAKEGLEKEKAELLQAKELIEREKADLEKNVLDLEELSKKLDADHQARTEELENQLQERSKERVAINQQERADLHAHHEKQVADLRLLFNREKQEAEEKVRKEHESKFGSRIRELEDAIAQHPVEILALRQVHEDERAGLERGLQEQKDSLVSQHKAELEKHTTDWTQKLKHKDLEFEKARETWVQSQDASHAHLEKTNEELVGSAGRLTQEVEKMKRILEAFGEATTMKSKGDSFFIESFQDLSQQIINLSMEFFEFLPIAPPHEILTKIPPGIPNFLDNTRASREIRAAYIQHLVSNILTYRIFQPFLFTLGRRFGKADTLFQKMSEDMRAKSTRREAVWRQQTLKAVYTASDAKQSVNVIAALIVDEIVEEIKHFSDPQQAGAITTAVRSIVKTAAETWRYARLERELITAAMPAAEDAKTPHEDWLEHEYEEHPPLDGVPLPEQHERVVLLRLLPIIVREAIHEDYPLDDDKQSAGHCIYLSGKALYSDSTPVVARKQELLQRAVDPSGITSSRPQSGVFSANCSDSSTLESHPQPPPLSPSSNGGTSLDKDAGSFDNPPADGGSNMARSSSGVSINQSEGSFTTGKGGDNRSETTARPGSVVDGGSVDAVPGPGVGPPGGIPDWGSANVQQRQDDQNW